MFEKYSGTLNDGNPGDTLTPGTRPCLVDAIFDLTNLLNAGDDFELSISVGAGGSERVVAYYGVTSDGTDLFIDPGSGVPAAVAVRRLGVSGLLVADDEVVKLDYVKNSANSRDIAYYAVTKI